MSDDPSRNEAEQSVRLTDALVSKFVAMTPGKQIHLLESLEFATRHGEQERHRVQVERLRSQALFEERRLAEHTAGLREKLDAAIRFGSTVVANECRADLAVLEREEELRRLRAVAGTQSSSEHDRAEQKSWQRAQQTGDRNRARLEAVRAAWLELPPDRHHALLERVRLLAQQARAAATTLGPNGGYRAHDHQPPLRAHERHVFVEHVRREREVERVSKLLDPSRGSLTSRERSTATAQLLEAAYQWGRAKHRSEALQDHLETQGARRHLRLQHRDAFLQRTLHRQELLVASPDSRKAFETFLRQNRLPELEKKPGRWGVLSVTQTDHGTFLVLTRVTHENAQIAKNGVRMYARAGISLSDAGLGEVPQPGSVLVIGTNGIIRHTPAHRALVGARSSVGRGR